MRAVVLVCCGQTVCLCRLTRVPVQPADRTSRLAMVGACGFVAVARRHRLDIGCYCKCMLLVDGMPFRRRLSGGVGAVFGHV